MPACPHCGVLIDGRDLARQLSFKQYRICPSCAGRFTVDTSTKYRQIIGIFMAGVSLALTMSLYFLGTKWLILALISYLILGLFIYWANRRVLFVPSEKAQSTTNDT